ncbi:nitrile hydratase accessory protein [Pseudonocardia endophytica]|uniref:Nitrile hydratase accessory protein n=1 Tax=Pseudonocardia endophytica TaxID=401976 RepID=A0A4R1HKL0_PSEEN|nr:nitrile hydratase accessory protein [Pseudonocardia endophytica]TCK21503.1 nitrile hydratase accessory protein [Pseudonocardia endophytica]
MGEGHGHGHEHGRLPFADGEAYEDLDATEVGEDRGGFRQDTTEIGDARRRVERLLCDMPQADKGFDEPWELRAFAMAVAAYHEGHYGWSEFQLSLIESIKQWEDGSHSEPWNYYEHWLNALETVLSSNGALSDQVALDNRTSEVLATPPNANHHRPRREPVAISPAVH